MPEFTADFGAKRGEKVDYAILQHAQPIILIEAKKHGAPLRVEQESQLFRYFSATQTRFGILTDGILYRFYSDLYEQNKMDSKPFFEFNMLEFTDSQVKQLKQFHKDNFDLSETIGAAREFKYTDEIKQALSEEMKGPSEQFVRFILHRIEYPGSKSRQRIAQFKPLVQSAFSNLVKDLMDGRLKSTLAQGNEQVGIGSYDQGSGVEVQPSVEPTLDLSLKSAGADAKGRLDTRGFTLLASSRLLERTTPTLPRWLLELKQSMIADGRLVDDGPEYLRLTQDQSFYSPTGASSLVLGRNATGTRNWRDSDGRLLDELMCGNS